MVVVVVVVLLSTKEAEVQVVDLRRLDEHQLKNVFDEGGDGGDDEGDEEGELVKVGVVATAVIEHSSNAAFCT